MHERPVYNARASLWRRETAARLVPGRNRRNIALVATDWQSLRAEFPLLDRWVYLNACSLGPLPRAGRVALERYAAAWDGLGTPAWYSDWLPTLDRLRAGIAELLHAPSGSTAIAPSVSAALTTLASGLPIPPGRRKVLIGALDFPTIGHQWLSRPEFEVEFVPSADGVTIPPEAFAERIDESTALVVTTHLFFTTGYLQDVRAIAEAAHRHGALCVIDGYQTVGCVPIDVAALDCDAFVGGCLKWLSGGPGTAFLYVRPSLIPSVLPQGTGWFATRDPFSFTLQQLEFAADARRLEGGTWAVPAHYAALAGLELVLSVGVEAIQERLRDLTDRILERLNAAGIRTLTPADRSRRCGIVTLECEQPEEVERKLLADGVVVDSRPGRLRLSPHWCVDEAELERGLDLVVAHVSQPEGAIRP